MIRPTKHLDLNTCILRAASRLLSKLQADRLCRFDELRTMLSDFGSDADLLFLPTVHFLFLMGRVQYHAQTDSFEYLHPVGRA